MIRRAALAFVFLAAASSATAGPPTPGIYGNVELSEESGDLGGAELALIGSGADARVELVICEGWCNAIITAPVRLSGGDYVFEYSEELYDQNGALSETHRYEALAMAIDDGISLTVVPDDPRPTHSPFSCRVFPNGSASRSPPAKASCFR